MFDSVVMVKSLAEEVNAKILIVGLSLLALILCVIWVLFSVVLYIKQTAAGCMLRGFGGYLSWSTTLFLILYGVYMALLMIGGILDQAPDVLRMFGIDASEMLTDATVFIANCLTLVQGGPLSLVAIHPVLGLVLCAVGLILMAPALVFGFLEVPYVIFFRSRVRDKDGYESFGGMLVTHRTVTVLLFLVMAVPGVLIIMAL